MTRKSILSILWTANPKTRRYFLILIDIFIITISFIFENYLISDSIIISNFYKNWTYLITLTFAIPLYIYTNQYRALSRYSEVLTFYQILTRNIFLFTFVYFIDNLFDINLLEQNSLILLTLMISLSQIFLRLSIRDFVNYSKNLSNIKKLKVVIYGAGKNGAQLFKNLRSLNKYQVVCFVDDNPRLWGRSITGMTIHPPKYLNEINTEINQLLLAIPDLKGLKKKEKINFLKNFRIPILSIPSTEQLISGQAKVDTLKPISINDLLGRDTVIADKELLEIGVKGKVIFVTGAGGSIGSELCKQIVNLNPKKLILFENNESSLYYVNNYLNNLNPKFKIIPILGNACNQKLLINKFSSYEVDIVFHAAAYKHVPLVEINSIEAISNNTISTLNVCLAAEASKVRNVVFISSDKAVRPTNIMGASKRLSELIIQAFSQKHSINSLDKNYFNLVFSMVRFGNVLDSSGSVVPLFKKQIEEGGPITLTHENIIRYFMTIPEASQLVLQSLALAKGGDLFLLDMGEPVSIKKLAEQMVSLSGQSIKDQNNPNGDIEIIITGIRPGEKLYEELLIDAKSVPTIHPLIFRASEKSVNHKIFLEKLDVLLDALNEYKQKESLNILKELVPEWKQSNFIS